MRLFALIACLIFTFPVRAADVVPSQFAGVWATKDSVFQGSSLIGGTAIYLDVDGVGALVGAPLPVGMCGDRVCTPIIGMPFLASMGKDGNTIRAVLKDGRESLEIIFAYDIEANTLVIASGGNQGQRLIRREPELSSAMRAALHGKQFNTPRAQQQP